MNEQQVSANFFFAERDRRTRSTAGTVLKFVLGDVMPGATSAVDVGCGVGTWLAVASELGVTRLRGFEGTPEALEHLVIPRDAVLATDLETDWQLPEHYDLGISLEVAEHLSPQAGERLVTNLAKACRAVVFSAATPGQGGNGHINEQWPTYWQQQFRREGMVAVDCLRPLIWYDAEVPWWYRENVVLYLRRSDAVALVTKLLGNDDFQADMPIIGTSVRPRLVQCVKCASIRNTARTLQRQVLARLARAWRAT